MKVSIVIAAYDEVANVEPLVRRLASRFASQRELEWDLLFVVEGRDGTREVLEGLSTEIPQLRILYQPEPSGLGNAFRRGFAAVPEDADYVVTLDADLNHRPEAIPCLLATAREKDLDVLVGSRFVTGSRVVGSPLWKRALSVSVNRLMSLVYRLEVADKTSGFRVYRAEVLRRITTESPGFAFLPEVLIGARAAGYRVDEAPIDFVFRQEGSSKMAFGATSLSYLGLFLARFQTRGLRAKTWYCAPSGSFDSGRSRKRSPASAAGKMK